jgi:hypothetical protein
MRQAARQYSISMLHASMMYHQVLLKIEAGPATTSQCTTAIVTKFSTSTVRFLKEEKMLGIPETNETISQQGEGILSAKVR